MSADITYQPIEFKCAECDEHIEGSENMVLHILKNHPDYSFDKSKYYARLWTDNAIDEYRQAMKDYYEDHQLDKAIERDAFQNK